MTVNSHCSLLFLLFLDSVYSVQNSYQGSSPLICSYPYSCIPTGECAERHSPQGTDQVLFQCEGKNRVCCPPMKFPNSQSATNSPSTVRPCSYERCQENSYQPNRQAGTSTGEYQGGTYTQAPMPSQPTESRRPVQPMEPRRPTQIMEGRRPSQSQSPQSSQNGFQSPHSSQTGFHATQSTQNGFQTPQNSQKGTQSRPQKPQMLSSTADVSQKQSSLTSHRNLRLLPKETECGVNNFANRITEGEEVSLGEYPWMALTGLKDKYGNYRWNCGGTLINGWYVLTAAHCLVVDNRTIEYVRLGEHSLRNETDCYRDVCLEPPEDVAIAEVIPHERWNTTTIKNDIALLRLSRNPLQLGKSNIYPICLPLDIEKLNITSSTKYEVAGWGKTDWNADEGSDVLRKASISGVNREECNICKDKKKQQYCPIINTQLCVQGWKSVDVCKGDSGGPLMVTRLNIYQIGITSFKGSEYCGAENIPSIFTKVESFLPWILDNIRQ